MSTSAELERIKAHLLRLAQAEEGHEGKRPLVEWPPFRKIRSYKNQIFSTPAGECVAVLLREVQLLESLPNVRPFPLTKLTPRYRITEYAWIHHCVQVIAEWRAREGFAECDGGWVGRAWS